MNYDEFKEKIQQDLVETLCEKQVDVTVSLYRTLTTEYPFIRHDPVVIAQVTCLVQYSPTEKPDCLRHGDDSNRDYETSA